MAVCGGLGVFPGSLRTWGPPSRPLRQAQLPDSVTAGEQGAHLKGCRGRKREQPREALGVAQRRTDQLQGGLRSPALAASCVVNGTVERELAFRPVLVPGMEADVESPNTRPQAVDLSPPSGEGPPRPASWLPHEPCAGTPSKVSSRFCVAQPGRHLSRYSARSGHPEPRAGRGPAFPGEGLDREQRPSRQGPPLMDRRVGRSPPSWAAVCVPRAAHSDPQRRFAHGAH